MLLIKRMLQYLVWVAVKKVGQEIKWMSLSDDKTKWLKNGKLNENEFDVLYENVLDWALEHTWHDFDFILILFKCSLIYN